LDWGGLPKPEDDGGSDHLVSMALPDIAVTSTMVRDIRLSTLGGLGVLYAFPLTAAPGVALLDGWDMILGTCGCTLQSCAFRDHFQELKQLGVDWVYGLSTQTTTYQREAVNRLHLPFELLSDAKFHRCRGLRLPIFKAAGQRLLRRLTLVVRDGVTFKLHYPVFPPDEDAAWVLSWLVANQVGPCDQNG
jgi:peroxiredoxin